MIKFVKGDLLSAPVEALVNTVNTVGVMGKGIALQFKERFPGNYAAYRNACRHGEVVVGKMFVSEERSMIDGVNKIIINFPTKKHWRSPSQLEYVEEGLVDLSRIIAAKNIKNIAIPPLGCGNGGLDWSVVKKMIETTLGVLDDVEILVYEPNESVKEILKAQDCKPVELTDAKAMLLYAMFYYESMGETISLFAANKLAYFYQRLGAKDFNRLRFEPYHYGPYCPGVSHLVHALGGQYLKGAEQMTEKAFEPLELQYDKLDQVSRHVKGLPVDKLQCVKNLIRLIKGFESALAIEVLASVDYVRKNHDEITLADTIQAVRQWNKRKHDLFKDEYMVIAYNRLEAYKNVL